MRLIRYILLLTTLATLARADDVFFAQMGACTILGGACAFAPVAGSAPHDVLRIQNPGCTIQCEYMIPDNVAFDADDSAGGFIAEIAAAPGATVGTGDFCWQIAIGAVADGEDSTAVNFGAITAPATAPLEGLAAHTQQISDTDAPLVPHTVAGVACANATCRARKAYARLTTPACATPLPTPQVVDVETLRLAYNPNPAATPTATP